jgi:hypothetical protein
VDTTEVVADVTRALTPFMSLLLRTGEHAADQAIEEAGNQVNAAGWALAKRMWSRLRSRAPGDPALDQAARQVAAAETTDADARKALRDVLERMLVADSQLFDELARLAAEGQRQAQPQTNIGREVNIGVEAGSIVGSSFNAVGKQTGPPSQ